MKTIQDTFVGGSQGRRVKRGFPDLSQVERLMWKAWQLSLKLGGTEIGSWLHRGMSQQEV